MKTYGRLKLKMISSLVWIVLIALLQACAARQEVVKTTLKLNVAKAFTADDPIGGGLLIWLHNTTNGDKYQLPYANKAQAQGEVIELLPGNWKVATVAWDGAGANELFKGASKCFYNPGIPVQGDRATINIQLNDAACSLPEFGNNYDVASKTFLPLDMVSCKSFRNIIDPATMAILSEDSNCQDKITRIGSAQSFSFALQRVVKGGLANIEVESSCFPVAGNFRGGSHVVGTVNMPLGSPNVPIVSSIYAYRNRTCDLIYPEDEMEYFFTSLSAPDVAGAGQAKIYAHTSNTKMRVFLPETMSGFGFSPFDEILPAIDCGGSPCLEFNSDGNASTVEIVINKYDQDTLVSLPTGNDYHPPGTSCSVDASSNILINNAAPPQSCYCDDKGCFAMIRTDQVNCSGPCISSLGATTNISYTIGGVPYSAVKVFVLDDKERELRQIVDDIVGDSDGRSSYNNTESIPASFGEEHYDNAFADMNSYIGPETFGGMLFKSGYSSCLAVKNAASISPVVSSMSFMEEGLLFNLQMIITPGVTTVSPLFYPAAPITQNYDLLVRIIEDGVETEKMELNCPGGAVDSTVQKAGYFSGNYSFLEGGDYNDFKRVVYWNVTNPASAMVESYAVSRQDYGNDLSVDATHIAATRFDKTGVGTFKAWRSSMGKQLNDGNVNNSAQVSIGTATLTLQDLSTGDGSLANFVQLNLTSQPSVPNPYVQIISSTIQSNVSATNLLSITIDFDVTLGTTLTLGNLNGTDFTINGKVYTLQVTGGNGALIPGGTYSFTNGSGIGAYTMGRTLITGSVTGTPSTSRYEVLTDYFSHYDGKFLATSGSTSSGLTTDSTGLPASPSCFSGNFTSTTGCTANIVVTPKNGFYSSLQASPLPNTSSGVEPFSLNWVARPLQGSEGSSYSCLVGELPVECLMDNVIN